MRHAQITSEGFEKTGALLAGLGGERESRADPPSVARRWPRDCVASHALVTHAVDWGPFRNPSVLTASWLCRKAGTSLGLDDMKEEGHVTRNEHAIASAGTMAGPMSQAGYATGAAAGEAAMQRGANRDPRGFQGKTLGLVRRIPRYLCDCTPGSSNVVSNSLVSPGI